MRRSSGKEPWLREDHRVNLRGSRFPCSFWGRNGVRWVVGGGWGRRARTSLLLEHVQNTMLTFPSAAHLPIRRPHDRLAVAAALGGWVVAAVDSWLSHIDLEPQIYPAGFEPRLGLSRCRLPSSSVVAIVSFSTSVVSIQAIISLVVTPRAFRPPVKHAIRLRVGFLPRGPFLRVATTSSPTQSGMRHPRQPTKATLCTNRSNGIPPLSCRCVTSEPSRGQHSILGSDVCGDHTWQPRNIWAGRQLTFRLPSRSIIGQSASVALFVPSKTRLF